MKKVMTYRVSVFLLIGLVVWAHPAAEVVSPAVQGIENAAPDFSKKNLPYELLAGWDFDEGSEGKVLSLVRGVPDLQILGNEHWVEDSGLEQVVFRFDGETRAYAPNIALPFNTTLSISAYLRKSEPPDNKEVLFAYGSPGRAGALELALDTDGCPILTSTELTASQPLKCKYLFLCDGNWYHLSVLFEAGGLRFYCNGNQVMQVSAEGKSVQKFSHNVSVGSNNNGDEKYAGFLAQVRLVKNGASPLTVAGTVPPPVVPEASPVWDYSRGLVFDRRQYIPRTGRLPGLPYASDCLIRDEDLSLTKKMGFDHVKLLFTSNFYMDEWGELTEEGMSYVTECVDRGLSHGLPVLICLHPEDDFKRNYLAGFETYERLLGFYEKFAAFIASHESWTPEKVSFQLMTEPYANISNWSYMQMRMWGAARKGAPDHTLIVSGDRAGNLEAMMEIIPYNDPNIYYSFTTYEPYEFGVSQLRGSHPFGGPAWYDTVGPIPYPVNREILETRLDEILKPIPEELRGAAEEELRAYAEKEYNRQWHFDRAKRVDDWTRKFGGKLRVMCVEFGCLDPYIFTSLQQRRNGTGISLSERLQYIDDIRSSFEEYGIGWCYWSYNEGFTVLDPKSRIPGTLLDEAGITEWIDHDMLTALGIQYKND